MKAPSSLGLRVLCAALVVLLGACSQTPVTVDLHSLQQSGTVSFVCRADDGVPTGHLLNECPDREHGSRHLLGLVTQTATDEVAIVDLYAGAVVDVDPGIPGYTFLRVGARPGAIVTTPGGAASFVGVTGLQKNGVFALPTTCLSAPEGTQKQRDLTTWSACALSSAPGDISVVVDPDGKKRGSCDGSPPAPVNQSGRDCPADLTLEGGAKGRRKLLVALPEEHKLVLLDAQALLDRQPGEFRQCTVEATYALEGSITMPQDQVVPVELQPDASATGSDACVVTPFPPLLASALPTPGGFALADSTLYVADRTLPLVHRLDVSDPCAPQELPPLQSVSYLDKTRVVTTSRVAVSPLTPAGNQYLYAVDDQDQPAASVMVFDVSPTSMDRTPLIFPHAELQPYSPPDRLRFNAPVRDVTFVLRDFPKPDPVTGVGQFGTLCNPDPGLDPTAPGALYRPNSDFSDGARPFNLRGLFGFAMLTNGQIAVIDVDDFDQPCRRPIEMNTSSTPDFRGCFSDKAAPNSPDPSYFTDTRLITGVPTVSNESSCTAIEPNRARSEFPLVSSATNGLHAPTLRAFPQFSNPDPSAVVAAGQQPRLLGADFKSPDPTDKAQTPVPAQVNISDQLYVNCATPPCDNGAEKLELDPAADPPNSVVLPLEEPRSYGADDSPVLTFEGRVFPDRTSGFLQPSGASTSSQGLLQDPDANYCAAGVEDADSILSEADALGISGATLRKNWAAAHADYVQITGDFPVDTDVYWTVGAGTRCSRDACSNEFGTIDNPAALSVSRDLSIVQAYGNRLVVTPRCETSAGAHDDSCSPSVVLQDLACCFPAGTPYTVRASHQWLLAAAGGLNDLASGPDGRCVHTASCDRRKQHFHQRAFEVCDSDPSADPNGTCKASDPTLGCVAGGSDIPVEPGGKASACIFENLTARFVVYRGSQPSTRGMSFTWQITGGFAPLTMSLATQSTQINPQSMAYIPELDQLAVIDGSTLGLSLFDLNSLAVSTPSPFF